MNLNDTFLEEDMNDDDFYFLRRDNVVLVSKIKHIFMYLLHIPFIISVTMNYEDTFVLFAPWHACEKFYFWNYIEEM